MFNANNCGYSLADIAAATGNNNGRSGGAFGDDWAWIIILLLCGWGNGGWGNGGFGGGNSGDPLEFSFNVDGVSLGRVMAPHVSREMGRAASLRVRTGRG